MAKITLNNISPTNSVTTASATINSNNDSIEAASDNTLSRDGTSPNQMGADLDMNSNQILNLPIPVSSSSPLRLQDLSTFKGGGTVTNIPSGGNTNDVLAKASNTNYDVHWSVPASNVVAAGANIAIVGSNPATVSTIPNPNFVTSVTTPNLVLNGTSLTTKTGAGAVVLATDPTFPNGITVGANTGSNTFNNVAIGTPASTATLNLGSGKTINMNNSYTTTATDGSTVAFGSGGTVLYNGGALGTPASGNLANATGLPILTGVSGLYAGVASFLNNPSSASLRTVLTGDTTGTGSDVFNISPTLLGVPLTPTAAVNTNNSQIASTAFVLGQGSVTSPLIDGTAAAGSSGKYSREDHVHPTDTTRAATASPTLTGTTTAATITASGVISTSNATASTTPSTGALIVTGGAGIGGDTYHGGAVLSTSPTSGIGYATGAGGTVTQLTNKGTAVTLNKSNGLIIMNNAALANGASALFQFNNSILAIGDSVIVHTYAGYASIGSYRVQVETVGAGSCYFLITNISGGSLSEAVQLKFHILKGTNS